MRFLRGQEAHARHVGPERAPWLLREAAQTHRVEGCRVAPLLGRERLLPDHVQVGFATTLDFKKLSLPDHVLVGFASKFKENLLSNLFLIQFFSNLYFFSYL